MSNNAFIENLKKTYEDSLKLIDNESKELISNDYNMAAIHKFTNHVGEISDIYDTASSIFSLIYKSRDMLEHFESSKIEIKQIPLVSFYKEETINDNDLEIYKKSLNENYTNFLDEDDNFEENAFYEFLVMSQLDESGYNKKHWYLKSLFINELEYMLDFLLKFVEESYNPIEDESEEETEDNKNRDRYISKTIKVAVWRRDLGKCVECGSKEKLEYDHIIPVAKGGSNTERNIQLLCEKCNRKKSDAIQ